MASISISFGTDTRSDNGITPGWIKGAMDAMERAGGPVCGTITIRGSDINLSLPVGTCPPAGGGGRPLNGAELDVVERWRRLHLDDSRIAPGELEAFVRQVLRLRTGTAPLVSPGAEERSDDASPLPAERFTRSGVTRFSGGGRSIIWSAGTAGNLSALEAVDYHVLERSARGR